MTTIKSSAAMYRSQDSDSSEAQPTINILLATFAGLGLPRTLSLPVSASASVCDVYAQLIKRLPCPDDSLVVTTVSNKQLSPNDTRPVKDFLSSNHDQFLSLRLSRRLCGGKGGFGSQLRAAGGRMNVRKNRDRQNQNVNGSNRNLDGRRLRIVDEAKKLADYLAIKPEMEKREKEEKKKRWEAVVEAADRRQEDIRSGKAGANRGRLDADYVESKELAEEKTREAVLKSLQDGTLRLDRTGSESSMDEHHGSESDEPAQSSGSSVSPRPETAASAHGQHFFGWDDEEDDEEDDDSEDDEDAPEFHQQVGEPVYEGKGKAKAA